MAIFMDNSTPCELYKIRYDIYIKQCIDKNSTIIGYSFRIFIYNYAKGNELYPVLINKIAYATIFLSFDNVERSSFEFNIRHGKDTLHIGDENIFSLKFQKPYFHLLREKVLMFTNERQLIFLLKCFHILEKDIKVVHYLSQPHIKRKLYTFIAMLKEELNKLNVIYD